MPWTSQPPNAGFSTGDPWLPVAAEHLDMAVAAQEGDPCSILALTRRLLALRRERSELRGGAIRLLSLPAELLLFERGEGESRLLSGRRSPALAAHRPKRPTFPRARAMWPRATLRPDEDHPPASAAASLPRSRRERGRA
jgi:hypothetical protein